MDNVQAETTRDYAKLVEGQKGLVIGLASGAGIAGLTSLILGGWVVPVIVGVVLGAVIGFNIYKNQ